MTVAASEPTTTGALDTLRAPYVVLRDLKLGAATLEHLVIGPGGVFAVESKQYGRPVVVHGRVALLGDRLLSPVLEPIARKAAAVRAGLGVDVRPLLCLTSPVEPDGKKDKLVVDGVEITSLRRLLSILGRDRSALPFEEVLRLGAVASARFAPAGRRPCACGGELVVRRRRSDGAAVITCTKYPVCRVAEPLHRSLRSPDAHPAPARAPARAVPAPAPRAARAAGGPGVRHAAAAEPEL